MRFCGVCGALLAVMPSEPVRERRLVSVLFCDLVGFTTFSEVRDLEDVRDVLDEYFAGAMRIVNEYGGTIEKFIGDAVMAVWGLRWRTRTMPSARSELACRSFTRSPRSQDAWRSPSCACGWACSPARPPSRLEAHMRAWSPATPSTRPRGSSQSRTLARCWSTTRPGLRVSVGSRLQMPASTRSRAGSRRCAFARAPRPRRARPRRRSAQGPRSSRSSGAMSSCGGSRPPAFEQLV